MKFVTSVFLFACLLSGQAIAENLRSSLLKKAALDNGFVPHLDTHVQTPKAMVELGHLVFQSTDLSLGRDISCATCHRDTFGSSDGIANAVGVGGIGEGDQRVLSGGRIVPRNTLPFWGVGGKGYDTFFWDGKVDLGEFGVISQFGKDAPSMDPLVVAAMLPPVEIDEMIGDVHSAANESVGSAILIYEDLVQQLASDPAIEAAAQEAYQQSANELNFTAYADAIAAFIRFNFAIQETRFHNFVFGDGKLSKDEISGGLIFYGKGRCAMCHNGAYFTDFQFHSIPSPSTKFGKNGFGVDYGRFNVTNDPSDLNQFRTPSLYNVAKTAPYGHSGAFEALDTVILAHSDPLAAIDYSLLTGPQRQDLYQQMRQWAEEPVSRSTLTASEIEQLILFLSTLEYDAKRTIVSPER